MIGLAMSNLPLSCVCCVLVRSVIPELAENEDSDLFLDGNMLNRSFSNFFFDVLGIGYVLAAGGGGGPEKGPKRPLPPANLFPQPLGCPQYTYHAH